MRSRHTKCGVSEEKEMGASASVPPREPVRPGVTRICVAGFPVSHNVGLTVDTARAIAAAHPEQYETWFYFASPENHRTFINEDVKPKLSEEQQEKFREHKSAPFCWLEAEGAVDCKGGGDRFREWALATFPETDSANEEIRALAGRNPSLLRDLFFSKAPGTSTAGGSSPESKANDSVAVTGDATATGDAPKEATATTGEEKAE